VLRFNLLCKVFLLVACANGALSQQSPAKPDIKKQAWDLLRSGVKDDNADHRATAVRVLSLLPGEQEAVSMACDALADPKPEVRASAAVALGQLHATEAIPELKAALDDQEVSVVLAAAHALLQLKDKSGYDVYYAILTGQRKGKGLVAEQLDTLRDPKKMAMLGFHEGIGFIPFAGISYTAIKTLMKDDASPVRAAAAKVLADDPDVATEEVLADAAVNDKNELVRAAAIDAIARRNHFHMVEKIVPAMGDEKDSVRYTAAAAVLHLSDVAARRVHVKVKDVTLPAPRKPLQ
jgi:HEAT repeat protein